MTVLVNGNLDGSPWFQSLRDELTARGAVSAVSSSTEDLLEIVKRYCFVGQYNLDGEECKSKLTVVLDCRDTTTVKGLLYILQNPQTLHRPRLILLSSVLTWAAGHENKGVTVEACTSQLFWDRLPLTSEYALYSDENRLVSLMLYEKLPGLEVCIVPTGLIYGGSGGDLESIMDSIWSWGAATDGACITVSSTCGPDAVVPMIHQTGLGRLVASLCIADSVPIYVPAADCSGLNLKEILTKSFEAANGSSTTADVVQFADESNVLDAVLYSNKATPVELLWGSNVNFSKECLGKWADEVGASLSDDFASVWAEYLQEKKLSPVSIYIAGTPGSGKSELGAAICSSLGCENVSLNAAIAYVVKDTTVDDDLDKSLRGVLIAAVEAEMEKSQPPPKKGEEPVKPEVDPESFESSDDLCAALDSSLKRRCIGFYIRNSSVCRRRGYVLDISGTNLVETYDHLIACTTGVEIAAVSSEQSEGGDEAKADTEPEAESAPVEETVANEGEERPSPAAPAKSGPELIIEVHATAEVLVARLCESLGIAEGTLAKAPKDQQANVKALEDQLAAYTATLQEIEYPEPEKKKPVEESEAAVTEEVAESKNEDAVEPEPIVREFSHSHPMVIRVEKMAADGSGTCQVLRIDATKHTAGAVRSIAATRLLEVHGNVGWLTQSEAAALVEMPPPAAESTAGEDAGNGDAVTGEATSEVAAEAVTESKEEEKEDTNDALKAMENPVSITVPTEAGVERTEARMKQTLNGATGDNREMLVNAANKLQDYLLGHVMPELASGMVQISTDRPVDPISFLADHLDKLAAAKEVAAEKAAKAHFDKLLAMAEGRWEEPEEIEETEDPETDGDFQEDETLNEPSVESGSI